MKLSTFVTREQNLAYGYQLLAQKNTLFSISTFFCLLSFFQDLIAIIITKQLVKCKIFIFILGIDFEINFIENFFGFIFRWSSFFQALLKQSRVKVFFFFFFDKQKSLQNFLISIKKVKHILKSRISQYKVNWKNTTWWLFFKLIVF